MSRHSGFIALTTMLLSLAPLACHAGAPTLAAPDTMRLTSPGITPGQLIPAQFACGGADVSPMLQWTRPPAGTRSQVLMLTDPDAPFGTFTHWILYDLPPTTTALSADLAANAQLPNGSMQARNDAHTVGYFGPCPPGHSTHRYIFHVYALNTRLPLAPGAKKQRVLQAMQGHLLAQGKLVAPYHR